RGLFLSVFAWYAYIYDRVPLPFWLGFCRNITENYFTHTGVMEIGNIFSAILAIVGELYGKTINIAAHAAAMIP
ncbi:hypothetical protein, partial [Compostibacillus humi]|uniref:hypothetical protein n=1 Tax=Compostibacillus humi TaxID=1245525 RepID=UPI001E388169